MNQYRKKPVVIEAMQYNGNAADIITWAQQNHQTITGGFGELQILTLEGTMTAITGDWIIKGVKGEFYPCKPDIFEATYEAVT